jgi:hypothetical protein
MKKVSMEKIWGNPRYVGKHIIIIAGRVFTAKTGREASQLFNKLIRKHPGKTPSLTYIPKAESLIL